MSYGVSVTDNITYVYVTENVTTLVTVDIGIQGEPGPSGGNSEVINATSSFSLTAAQTGSLVTNVGATGQISVDLPYESIFTTPLTFTFFDSSGDGIQVIAPSGVTIQNGSDISPSGGAFTSTGLGNLLSITLISNTVWVATGITGIWNISSVT